MVAEVIGEVAFTFINQIYFTTNISVSQHIFYIIGARIFPKAECMNTNFIAKECKQYFGFSFVV